MEVLSSCPSSDSWGGLGAEGTSSRSADRCEPALLASRPARSLGPAGQPWHGACGSRPPPPPGLNYCNIRSWLGPLPKVEQARLLAGREQVDGLKGSVCSPEAPRVVGLLAVLPGGWGEQNEGSG